MAFRVSVTGTDPVSRAEAVAYAKIENTSENSIIDALIDSCRNELEIWLSRPLITQTWAEYFDTLEKGVAVYSNFGGLSNAVLEVADANGVYTINPNIVIRYDTGRIIPTDIMSSGLEYNGFKITYTYTVSSMTAVTPVMKNALLELISFRFYNRGAPDSIPTHVRQMVRHFRIYRM